MAKRKWEALRDKYPMIGPDPENAEAFAVVAESLRGKTLAEVADAYDEARATKERLKDEHSAACVIEDATELVLADMLKAQGLTDVRATSGFNYSTSIEPYPSVTDKPEFQAWLVENMPENIMLHHGTLKSVVKAALESGEPTPPGVGIFMKPTFSRRK